MRGILSVAVVLCASVAYGQGGPGWVPGVPYQPANSGVVNQQVVNPPVHQPPMVPVPPGYTAPSTVPQNLPIYEWRDGLRESFTHSDVHEIRPIKEWENYPHYFNNQQQNWYYQQQQQVPQYYQYPQQQYWYQPQYYQQPQYYYQPRCYPQQTYCYPQTQCYWYYQKPCWQQWLGL